MKQMIVCKGWNTKKQLKSFQLHQENINNLWIDYNNKFEYIAQDLAIPENRVFKTYPPKIRYTFQVKDIFKKYSLAGMHELIFLLMQHPDCGYCQYCGDGRTFFNRHNELVSSCRHGGYCNWKGCKEPTENGYRCDIHVIECEKYRELEKQENKRKWESTKYDMSVQDLIIDDSYILCIEEYNSTKVAKRLLNTIVKIVIDKDDLNICHFWTSDSDKYYTTWLSKQSLIKAIDWSIEYHRQFYN